MATGITIAPQSTIKTFYAVDGFTAVTGGTANTLTGSVLIPANTVSFDFPGSIAEITARAIKTGVAGLTTLRIYINTDNSLSGATLLATGGIATATDLFQQVSRTLFIGKGPVNVKTALTSAQLYSDDTRTTTTESSVVVDWTSPQYIILAVQNAAAGDSTTGSGIFVKIYT